MTDLAWLTVAEAGPLLRGKKISPVEYARALIERIERHDRKLNAFLRFTPDLALADARRAETEIVRGEWRGPFHGVPYGLKDIVDYAGLPTTGHSKILRDNVATTDAVVTQKLRAAGGVFMGKLATHEFAIGGPSFDLPWPPARNPWHRDHFCGGSSSGSGAATAAGFLPAAIGTDTGGSVRNPAAMCGVAGSRPPTAW
jgi:aspartyl-tRNA(Asn)/glutamyl-tRNA(Gln) amidotransferase subunit A